MHLVSPDEVAAIVVEPIQGEGGYVVPPAVFHERLRALASRHGMLLVADEVQSGMGRTGKMFAIEHFGVQPDIVACAKGIASGMPLGVCVARAEVMSWPPGRAREHVRRQPGVVRGGDCDDRAAEARADAERGGGRRATCWRGCGR